MAFSKSKALLSIFLSSGAILAASGQTYAGDTTFVREFTDISEEEKDLLQKEITRQVTESRIIDFTQPILSESIPLKEDLPLEQIQEKEAIEQQKFHNTEEYYYVTEDTTLTKEEGGISVSIDVKKGDYIKCIAKDVVDNKTFLVEIGKQRGFIDAEKLSKEIVFKDENDKVYFKKQANVYELPDENSAILCVGHQFDTIQAIGRADGWIRVQFSDNTIAYVKDDGSTDYTSNYQEKTVTTISYKRNLKYNKEVLTGNSYDNKKIIQNSNIGQSIIDYATQFVGNPYVYGGTSLTHGTDCSGFTQGVYKHFGIYINRTSYDQARNGRSVRLDEARPGDLIIYNGHVGLYMAPGKMVHASSPRTGIMIGPIHYGSRVVDVRRIVE